MISKVLLSACFLFLVGDCFAQNNVIAFNVEVQLETQVDDKYAYLYLNESKRLLITNIQNKRFYFSGIDTLGKKGLNFGHLFLSKDSLDRYIPLKEIALKNINRKYRSIVLEDAPLKISIKGDIRYAKIEGGELNKEYDEMNLAISELKYKEFIESHSNSLMSLLLIRSTLPLRRFPIIDQLDFQGLYEKLSDKIRQSEYGLETQEKIKDIKL